MKNDFVGHSKQKNINIEQLKRKIAVERVVVVVSERLPPTCQRSCLNLSSRHTRSHCTHDRLYQIVRDCGTNEPGKNT